jgi:hypothetical protein
MFNNPEEKTNSCLKRALKCFYADSNDNKCHLIFFVTTLFVIVYVLLLLHDPSSIRAQIVSLNRHHENNALRLHKNNNNNNNTTLSEKTNVTYPLNRTSNINGIVPFDFIYGLNRLYNYNGMPYLRSGYLMDSYSTTSSSGSHGDILRFFYVNKDTDLVFYDVYNSESCVSCTDSIFFAFSGAGSCHISLNQLKLKVEEFLFNPVENKYEWKTILILPFNQVPVADNHYKQSDLHIPECTIKNSNAEYFNSIPFLSFGRGKTSHDCAISSGLFITFPICYRLGLRLSVVWEQLNVAIWDELNRCVYTDELCPIGVYQAVYTTNYNLNVSHPSTSFLHHPLSQQQEEIDRFLRFKYSSAANFQDLSETGFTIGDNNFYSLSESLESKNNNNNNNNQRNIEQRLATETGFQQLSPAFQGRYDDIVHLHKNKNGEFGTLVQQLASFFNSGMLIHQLIMKLVETSHQEDYWIQSVKFPFDARDLRVVFHKKLNNEIISYNGSVVTSLSIETENTVDWSVLDLLIWFDCGEKNAMEPSQPVQTLDDEIIRVNRQIYHSCIRYGNHPQVDVPLDLFFGMGDIPSNEANFPVDTTMFGGGAIHTMFLKQNLQGKYKGITLYAMPFWKEITIAVRNRNRVSMTTTASIDLIVAITGRDDVQYDSHYAGYFNVHYHFGANVFGHQFGSKTSKDQYEPHWSERNNHENPLEHRGGRNHVAVALEDRSDDFVKAGSAGLWRLHSLNHSIGSIVRWNIQVQSVQLHFIESDLRLRVDGQNYLIGTGFEDYFYGTHGYSYNPFELTKTYGFCRTRFHEDYQFSQYRNLLSDSIYYQTSLDWSLEIERNRNQYQMNSVLFFYAKSFRYVESNNEFHGARFSESVGRTNNANEYELTSLDVFNETDPAGGPLREAFIKQSIVTRMGQVYEYKTNNNDIVFQFQLLNIPPKHSHCELIRTVDNCASIQTAKVYLEHVNNNPLNAPFFKLDSVRYVYTGLWYSSLRPCTSSNAIPSARFTSVKYTLPNYFTKNKSTFNVLLMINPLSLNGSDSDIMDIRYNSVSLHSEAAKQDKPVPIFVRSYTHFEYSVHCIQSPIDFVI